MRSQSQTWLSDSNSSFRSISHDQGWRCVSEQLNHIPVFPTPSPHLTCPSQQQWSSDLWSQAGANFCDLRMNLCPFSVSVSKERNSLLNPKWRWLHRLCLLWSSGLHKQDFLWFRVWGFSLSVVFSSLKGFALCYPFQAEPQHFLGVRVVGGGWEESHRSPCVARGPVAITVVKCGLWSQAAGALTWTPSYSCHVTRGKLAPPIVPLPSIKWSEQYPITQGSVLQWEVSVVAGQALNFRNWALPRCPLWGSQCSD